jgi:hypothetical protein
MSVNTFGIAMYYGRFLPCLGFLEVNFIAHARNVIPQQQRSIQSASEHCSNFLANLHCRSSSDRCIIREENYSKYLLREEIHYQEAQKRQKAV